MDKRYYTKKALDNAKTLRITQTDAENMLWYHLRNRKLNGIKFRRQVPIDKYIVDFLCNSKKLIVELDGSQHLDNEEYDRNRTLFLSEKGYTLIRVYNDEIVKNLNNVLDYIYTKYNEL